MICRQHQQYRVIVLHEGMDCGDRYRRCGVSAERFEDDGQIFDTDLACLLGDDETVFIVADNDRRAVFQAIDSRQGFLQHGFVMQQAQKLLRIHLAR